MFHEFQGEIKTKQELIKCLNDLIHPQYGLENLIKIIHDVQNTVRINLDFDIKQEVPSIPNYKGNTFTTVHTV